MGRRWTRMGFRLGHQYGDSIALYIWVCLLSNISITRKALVSQLWTDLMEIVTSYLVIESYYEATHDLQFFCNID